MVWEAERFGPMVQKPLTQPMQRELDSLVRKLDRKIDLHWVEEMRLGKPAYDHLIGCVRAKTLTRHQLTNALICLFTMRDHGSEEEVFALLRDHTTHGEIRVRTKAVTLLNWDDEPSPPATTVRPGLIHRSDQSWDRARSLRPYCLA